MGELLAELPKAGGTRGNLLSGSNQVVPPEKFAENATPTLAERGITKRQSATWQAMAKLPRTVQRAAAVLATGGV